MQLTSQRQRPPTVIQGDNLPDPAIGYEGDIYLRTGKPFRVVVYKKLAGIWTLQENTYSWAGKPVAEASNEGVIITINSGLPYIADFRSTNIGGGVYSWVPTRGWYRIGTNVPTDFIAGTTAPQTAVTDTIPGGLVIPGCICTFKGSFRYDGTTGVKSMYITVNGQILYNGTGFNGRFGGFLKDLVVEANGTGGQFSAPGGILGLTTSGTGTVQSNSFNIDLTNDWPVAWGFDLDGGAADSGRVLSREVRIWYPV